MTQNQWQPIETAPRDGRRFLLSTKHASEWQGMFVAYWNKSEEEWFFTPEHYVGNPTHWMPLPQPPDMDKAA